MSREQIHGGRCRADARFTARGEKTTIALRSADHLATPGWNNMGDAWWTSVFVLPVAAHE